MVLFVAFDMLTEWMGEAKVLVQDEIGCGLFTNSLTGVIFYLMFIDGSHLWATG